MVFACAPYGGDRTDTAFSYVGGGLPGGDEVDASEGDRKVLSRSYAVTTRVLGGLQYREADGKRLDPPQTGSVAGGSEIPYPFSESKLSVNLNR